MKLLSVLLVVVAAVVFGAEEQPEGELRTTYRRLIPADVLRDFPGMCFASTKCATFEPNQTWDLSPFCGRSTCIEGEKQNASDPSPLFELVEDCGPLPLPQPKCKLSEKTDKTAPFPNCCPQFECEEGVKLEYPEIPTQQPPTEKETTETEKPAAVKV